MAAIVLRARRMALEEGMQIRCMEWLRAAHPRVWEVTHHSPNGGRRSLAEGAAFKAMGTKAGFPDLFIYEPRGDFGGLALELKTARGSQSPAQRWWERALMDRGYAYRVVKSDDEFRRVVEAYLGLEARDKQLIINN